MIESKKIKPNERYNTHSLTRTTSGQLSLLSMHFFVTVDGPDYNSDKLAILHFLHFANNYPNYWLNNCLHRWGLFYLLSLMLTISPM